MHTINEMTILLIAGIIVIGIVAYNVGWYVGFKTAYDYKDAWMDLGRMMQRVDDAADKFADSEDDRRAVEEAHQMLNRQRAMRRGRNKNQ